MTFQFGFWVVDSKKEIKLRTHNQTPAETAAILVLLKMWCVVDLIFIWSAFSLDTFREN